MVVETADLLQNGLQFPFPETEAPTPLKPRIVEISHPVFTDPQQINGAIYESKGLEHFGRTRKSDRFILGPALIDRALCNIGYRIPDLMVFKPVGDAFVLEEIAEFKFGTSRYKSEQKIKGLEDLIQLLRVNPTELNRRISGIIPHEIPRLLMPHPHEEIPLRFISPRLTPEGTLTLPDTSFKVIYETLKGDVAA